MNHYTITSEIGAGTYGKVYEAIDTGGRKTAIKQIKCDHNGLPFLVESTIMASIRHPNLSWTQEIMVTSKNLNIVQEKAVSDLAVHTKGKVHDLSLVRKWLYSVTEAVGALHHFGLIHADIKGGNVLYFSDDDVRLTDFTLTTKKWKSTDTFNHAACTYSHSPPEALRGDRWNQSLDVWSLGCLYYEIAFGSFLFPQQGKNDDKKDLKRRYYNAIADWFGMGILGTHNHKSVVIHPCYKLEAYAVLRDLIDSVLLFSWRSRPSIDKILEHPFFTGLVKVPMQIREPICNFVDVGVIDIMSDILSPSGRLYDRDGIQMVAKVAYEIYRRALPLSTFVEKVDSIKVGCCWIAGKIVYGDVPILKSGVGPDEMLEVETLICTYLEFCFPILTDF